MDWIRNKTILVTGGTGTIGSELVRQILTHDPKQVRILSRDDTKQYELLESLNQPSNVRLLIGDIRDRERLNFALSGVDMVFHAAALKHVPICEYNPYEAINTNVTGSQNLIDAAIRNGVRKVVAISTDKAANPTNIMGMTKLLMERLFINANYSKGKTDTAFSCVRFGNVTWSRGSVLPLWERQIKEGGKIKITNPKMTRFFMSKAQAIYLTLKAMELSEGGEIFVFKMPSITLGGLAKIYLQKHHADKKVRTERTKARAGEKLHEELLGTPNGEIYVHENKEMLILLPDPNIHHIGKSSYQANVEERKYPSFRKISTPNALSSRNKISEKMIRLII